MLAFEIRYFEYQHLKSLILIELTTRMHKFKQLLRTKNFSYKVQIKIRFGMSNLLYSYFKAFPSLNELLTFEYLLKELTSPNMN